MTGKGTLMVRCITQITIEQVPVNNDGRDLKLSFDFVNSFDGTDTWVNLTNTLKLVFPKNVYVRDTDNNLIPLGGNVPKKLISWLFRRGDKVTLNYGYYTYDMDGKETKDMPATPVFTGYISKVLSKMPINIECEDNMWILKQIPCSVKHWPKDKTLEELLNTLIPAELNFGINILTKTTIGSLIIENESIAQLLQRIRKDYHLEAYFRGNNLRVGSQVYIEDDAIKSGTKHFIFQENIISSDLEYQRKDDIKMSAVCNSITTSVKGQNKKGKDKVSNEKLSVLVYSDQATGNFKYIVKKKDVEFPANEQGERRTFFFPNVTSAAELAQLGADKLKTYYYTGFKGNFTTFGIPYVRQGDNISLTNRSLPDQDGTYKVRGVNYKGGTAGHRQVITLDYLLVTKNGVVLPDPPPAVVTPA